jgi:hypothetical protein
MASPPGKTQLEPATKDTNTSTVHRQPVLSEDELGQSRPRSRPSQQLSARLEPGAGGAGRARTARALQRSVGNARLARMLEGSTLRIQRKLSVSAPGDAEELEANSMARRVVGRDTAPGGERPSGGDDVSDVSSETAAEIDAERGRGQPLPDATRRQMEDAFDADFARVRVHADAPADKLNRSMAARAFSTGQDVFFRQGEYQPGTSGGQELLAHELTHTIQQGEATGRAQHALQVQRDAPVSDPLRPPAQSPAVPARSVAMGTVSDYRTAMEGYITNYRVAALAGMEDFKNAVAPDFDWTLFGVQVLGNVIWATASFASGGTAFAISMAGIAVTTAGAAAAVTSAPTFESKATAYINDIDKYLHDQVDRVTQDVHAQGTREGWDDNRARLEILRRMYRPTYITKAQSGLPYVDSAAIEAAVEQQLLIGANASQPAKGSVALSAVGHLIPTIIRGYHGYLMYSYGSENVEHDEGLFYHNTMNDIPAWRLSRSPSVSLVPAANVGDINASMNAAQKHLHGEQMHVATWPCKKAINIYDDKPEDPLVIVELTGSNAVSGVQGWGVVHDYLESHDAVAFGQRIATRVWGSTTPPDVADLAAPPEMFEANPMPISGPR